MNFCHFKFNWDLHNSDFPIPCYVKKDWNHIKHILTTYQGEYYIKDSNSQVMQRCVGNWLLCIIGRNVNMYNYYGKQYEESWKKVK